MKPRLCILAGQRNFAMPTFAESDPVKEQFHVIKSTKVKCGTDIVFCQTFLQCADQLRKWNGPCVITIGGVMWWEFGGKRPHRIGELLTMNKGRTVAFMSRWLKNEFVRRGLDCGRGAMLEVLPGGHWGMDHVINGVQLSRFGEKTKYSLHEPPTVIMSINLPIEGPRWIKCDGIPATLEVLEDVARRHRVRFVCAGIKHRDFPKLKEWTRRFNFEFVQSHHKLPGPDLWPDMLRSADIFLHPSMCDGWSRAVADAMCVGVPAMVLDRTGPPEVGDSLLLYDVDKPEQACKMFDALIRDEGLRKEIGMKQRAEALRRTELHRGDLAELLAKAVERGR